MKKYEAIIRNLQTFMLNKNSFYAEDDKEAYEKAIDGVRFPNILTRLVCYETENSFREVLLGAISGGVDIKINDTTKD